MDDNNKKQNLDFADQVMNEIHDKHIQMRPKVYFVIGSLLLSVGVLLSFSFATLVVHFISYRLQADGPFEYFRLGLHGSRQFLELLPWPFIFLLVALIGFGIYLIRKSDYSYKYSSYAVVGVAFVGVLLGGVVIDRLGVGTPLKKFAPIKGVYEQRGSNQKWIVGEIIELEDNKLVVQTIENKEVIVGVTELTRKPKDTDFKIGDRIHAFGEWKRDVFYAAGILNREWGKREVLPWMDHRNGKKPPHLR